jgi:hypothetical protein
LFIVFHWRKKKTCKIHIQIVIGYVQPHTNRHVCRAKIRTLFYNFPLEKTLDLVSKLLLEGFSIYNKCAVFSLFWTFLAYEVNVSKNEMRCIIWSWYAPTYLFHKIKKILFPLVIRSLCYFRVSCRENKHQCFLSWFVLV